MFGIVPEHIEQYSLARSQGFGPLLDELLAATEARTDSLVWISGPLVGGVLRMVASLIGARRVVEVGMFTGYGALCIAEALPEGGEVHSCEISEQHMGIAREFFDRSPHGSKINVHVGDARETLASLEGPFDMAFIDADKIGYPDYYETCINLLRPGGAMLIDNVLWRGKVLQPDDEQSRILDSLNRRIEIDERVDRILLTVRDGLFLLRKR